MPIPLLALEDFSGPIDLLTSLVQKKELEADSLQIRLILKQLFSDPSSFNPLAEGSDAISHASLLLLLKSRALLPNLDHDDEETILSKFDPETLEQLVHYCAIREKVEQLSFFEEKGLKSFTRPELPIEVPAKGLGIDHVSLDELAGLFRDLLKKAAQNKGTVHNEAWKVSDKIAFFRKWKAVKKELSIIETFSSLSSKLEIIVTFLAILELMKLGEINLIKQNEKILIQFTID